MAMVLKKPENTVGDCWAELQRVIPLFPDQLNVLGQGSVTSHLAEEVLTILKLRSCVYINIDDIEKKN